MSHSAQAAGGSNVSRALARDRLGVPAVAFFVLSATTPMTVVAGVVTTGYAVTGVTGLPFAFVIIAAILMLFSVGYVAMSRHITNAGAFYTYIARGLGRPAGVGAAWAALVAYNALQVGLYGIIGAAAAPRLQDWFDINPSWWVVALVAWAIVALTGLLGVDVNGRILAVLLLAEIAILLIFGFADLANPAGGDLTFDTLSPANLFESGVGAILALAILGFIGFETAVVYSEESRNPKRTVAIATYMSILVVAVVYTLSSWAMSVATGPDNIVAFAGENGPGTIFVLAGEHLGNTWVEIGETLFVTSLLAAMISFHNTCARYGFAIGRERVLPGALGQTSLSTGAPMIASIIQSVIGLAVIIWYAAADLDPVVQLFFYWGTGGAFGVLLLLTATSLAVIAFFARRPSGETVWRRLIAPALAAIALGIVVVLALDNFDTLLGVAPDNNLRWIIPAVFPIVFLLGVLWALFLRANSPEVYSTIGLGAHSVTGLDVIEETPSSFARRDDQATTGDGKYW
ncbi:MAG TPA: APC family permease [Actinomycetes bacterium]|nr:APC family permease [Actinomycetes bacterium]